MEETDKLSAAGELAEHKEKEKKLVEAAKAEKAQQKSYETGRRHAAKEALKKTDEKILRVKKEIYAYNRLGKSAKLDYSILEKISELCFTVPIEQIKSPSTD